MLGAGIEGGASPPANQEQTTFSDSKNEDDSQQVDIMEDMIADDA